MTEAQAVEPSTTAVLDEGAKPVKADAQPQEAAAPRVPVLMGSRGLVFASLPDMWRFAQYVHEADWGPKNSTPESNLVAIQFGAELGVPAMQAIQNIAPINGRPCAYGDLPLGLCMRSPYFDHAEFREWWTGTPYDDDFMSHCQARRQGGNVVEATFSVAEAKRAGLWEGAHSVGKFQKSEDTVWYKYAKRMLRYRARGFCLRDTFPDVLMGLHTGEEMSDVDQIMSRLDLGKRSAPAATDTEESPADLRERLTAPERAKTEKRKPSADLTPPPPTTDPQPAKRRGRSPKPKEEPPPPESLLPVEPPTERDKTDKPELWHLAIGKLWLKIPLGHRGAALLNIGVAIYPDIAKIADIKTLREIHEAFQGEVPSEPAK